MAAKYAWDSVDVIWDDFGMEFICPCGETLILSEPGSVRCDCGKLYSLKVEFRVSDDSKET